MLHWKVTPRGTGECQVMLYGEITEATSFGELRELRGSVILDLAGVRRINSFGVRELLNFLVALRKNARLEAERCSPAIVMQLNMLPEFSRQVTVRSVIQPIECPSCFEEREITVEIPRGTHHAPPVRAQCEACGTGMVSGEPVERYYAFLDTPSAR